MTDDLLASARDSLSDARGNAVDVRERWLHLVDVPSEVPESG
jgi:hypothetical protein